jgi:hypothetical protein
MVKALGYGGDIPPLMAAYANSDLPKQYAIIKSAKQKPVRVRIPDVPDAKISSPEEKDFIKECLSYEWNFGPKEIRQQMEKRFNERRPPAIRPTPPQTRAVPDREAVSSPPKTKRKSLLDIKD